MNYLVVLQTKQQNLDRSFMLIADLVGEVVEEIMQIMVLPGVGIWTMVGICLLTV